jgi:hypothetical protein
MTTSLLDMQGLDAARDTSDGDRIFPITSMLSQYRPICPR